MAGRALSHRKAPSSLRLLPQVIPDRTCTVGKPQGSESMLRASEGLGLGWASGVGSGLCSITTG